MKKCLLWLALAGWAGSVTALAASGWHWGETKDLEVGIEYFDYAYLDASGDPVYYIGSPMRYRLTLKNGGKRAYNNFQARSILKWQEAASCQRWWLDNQSVSYMKDAPLPGNPDSGFRPADMGKAGQASYEATYVIPLEICPGIAYLQVEGKHRNAGGNEEAASFAIPKRVRLERKK